MFNQGNFQKINGAPCRRAGDEKAQGMVEFALVLPLLLMLVFGILEFGRLFTVYASVLTASREAARYGSAAGDVGSGVLQFHDCNGIVAAAHRMGILADIQVQDNDITYDSGPGSTNIASSCSSLNPNDIEGGRSRIEVTVRANYTPILPFFNIGSFTLTSTSARTIFSNIVVGRNPPNPIHIAGITPHGTKDSHNPWFASWTISVMDREGNPVSGALVRGFWKEFKNNPGGGSGTLIECTTNASGLCTTTPVQIKKDFSAIYSVADLIHSAYGYDPSADTPNPASNTIP